MLFMTSRASLLFLAFLSVAALPRRAAAGDGAAGAVSPRQLPSEVEDIGQISEPPAAAGNAENSKFRLNVSTRVEYTSNAELSGNHGSSDVIFLPAIEAGYTTPLGHGFDFDLTSIIEAGLYSDRTNRSFLGYSTQATLDWKYDTKWPRLYMAVDPYRFDSFDRGGLITEAIGTLVGTDWGLSFNAGKSYAFVGYTFENDFSDPTEDNRSSHRAVIGISQQLRPRLFAQLYYQYQYSNYQNVARDDSSNAVTASLIWQLNRHLFSTMSASYIDNNSTEDHASYRAVTTSLGLSYQF
jgi:hypothetical protein